MHYKQFLCFICLLLIYTVKKKKTKLSPCPAIFAPHSVICHSRAHSLLNPWFSFSVKIASSRVRLLGFKSCVCTNLLCNLGQLFFFIMSVFLDLKHQHHRIAVKIKRVNAVSMLQIVSVI